MNSTTTGFYAMSSFTPATTGILIGIGVFISIIVTIFILSKNFRRFFYGLFILIPLSIVYFISKNVGVSYSEGNINPFKWVVGIISTIILSILVGKMIENTKTIKNIERKIK